MTKITIHVLPTRKKAHDACVLVERLYLAGRKVVIWVAEPGRAEILDQYLWTFSQPSFVPHCLGDGSHLWESEPVVIVTGEFQPPPGADALVLVDRLPDPAAASFFPEVHDLDAGGDDDAGKSDQWAAAGFEVVTARGVDVGPGPA